MKKIIILILILLIPSTSFAESYYYESINLNVTVLENGDLRIIENETLSFQGRFTYVYRNFNSEVSNLTIISEDRVLDHEKEGSTYTWRGSWTDTTKTFTLKYIIKDAFTILPENDELYYTIVFHDRNVPVYSSTAYFNFNEEINLTQLEFRTNMGEVRQVNPRTIVLTANDITSNQAFDFEIKTPKGFIKPQNTWKNIISMNPWVKILAEIIIAIPFLLFAYFTLKGYLILIKMNEKRKKEKPPKKFKVEDLPPAMAGLVVDSKAGPNEVIATIIDLAIRGYIHIHKIEKKLWFDEVRFVKVKKNYSKLNDYEKKIMQILFDDSDMIKLSEMRRKFQGTSTLTSPLKKIYELMNKEGVKLKLFPEEVSKMQLKIIGNLLKYPLISLISSFIYSFIIIILTRFFILFFFAFIIIILNLLTLILFGIISQIFLKRTEKGEAAKLKYEELKEFIKTYPLKEGRIFDTYLPQAIALGVQKEWVKKAEDLKYKAKWHDKGISTAGLIAITSSMSSSISPSGSGGFSGGAGFGGGGGAGGGGGGAG